MKAKYIDLVFIAINGNRGNLRLLSENVAADWFWPNPGSPFYIKGCGNEALIQEVQELRKKLQSIGLL